ncbi:BQ2448_5106 [Microbotryum intermedium]|uniref:BQ2448_5106 protein n=1 Tax=Microbotryum intermedium TaxID=269621 RepID=A0A238F3B2_9BASI|nr:BQ2448_5106 [Microbotryum intermedium]
MNYVGRDPSQETGVLFEKAVFNALNVVNRLSDQELDPIIKDAVDDAAAKGVAEIVEMEMIHNLAVWKRRIQEMGIDKLRIHAGMYEYDEHIHDAIDHNLKSGDVIPEPQGLFQVRPYKIITVSPKDGSLGARSAYCFSPYPGTNSQGEWIYPTATLVSILQFGTSHSLRLAVHAIGDLANRLTLQAFHSLHPPC